MKNSHKKWTFVFHIRKENEKKKSTTGKLLLTTYITGTCQTQSKDRYTYIAPIYKCQSFFPQGPSKLSGPLLVPPPNFQVLLSNTSRKVQLSHSESISRQLFFKEVWAFKTTTHRSLPKRQAWKGSGLFWVFFPLSSSHKRKIIKCKLSKSLLPQNNSS